MPADTLRPTPAAVVLRTTPQPGDVAAVRALVHTTGFFSAAEVGIAAELVQESLSQGSASGYEFLLLEQAQTLLGYTCYGEIPGTAGSYDLYWIVVAPDRQGRGLGQQLLAATETAVRARGGRLLYAETSARAQYAPTRHFYERAGFHAAARLPDFYAPGDGKVIYAKALIAAA
ncbi:MAG: GNAT family N-acetyltransferase [Pseudomonadota bacterium]